LPTLKQNKIISWEGHLVRQATSGDAIAFDLIIDLYRPSLMRQAMKILHNVDDAYDAVQETILKSYRAIPEFDPERPIRPWLTRICGNVCIDIVRQRKSRPEPLEDFEFGLVDERSACDQIGDENIRRFQLMNAIAELPVRYREIILMRHVRQMEVLEIAEALQEPEGTVKSLLFRARHRLRQRLEPSLA
jgi:RNA polymerase sigma-70 factor (ECF subfamily)